MVKRLQFLWMKTNLFVYLVVEEMKKRVGVVPASLVVAEEDSLVSLVVVVAVEDVEEGSLVSLVVVVAVMEEVEEVEEDSLVSLVAEGETIQLAMSCKQLLATLI
jgi:hypothetical protein